MNYIVSNTNRIILMDILEEEFKTEIIYVLLITLSSPIIGIKNYDEYYNHKNDYTIPVYKKIMVMKYGKVDSTSNIDKRIKEIKREYSAIDVEILLLIKSKDLNMRSLSKLETDFKYRINMNTCCKIILATQKNGCIFKRPNEFITVNFESLCEIRNFFISEYSKIVYDPYKLLNIHSIEDFDRFIDSIPSESLDEPLILDSNMYNLSTKEDICIKQYTINTYLYEDIEDFQKLLENGDEEEVWETDDEENGDEEAEIDEDDEDEENGDEDDEDYGDEEAEIDEDDEDYVDDEDEDYVDDEDEENGDEDDEVDEDEVEVDEEEVVVDEKAEVIIHNEYMLLSLFILCFFVYVVINENIIVNDNNAFNKYSIFNDDTNIVTHEPFYKIYC